MQFRKRKPDATPVVHPVLLSTKCCSLTLFDKAKTGSRWRNDVARAFIFVLFAGIIMQSLCNQRAARAWPREAWSVRRSSRSIAHTLYIHQSCTDCYSLLSQQWYSQAVQRLSLAPLNNDIPVLLRKSVAVDGISLFAHCRVVLLFSETRNEADGIAGKITNDRVFELPCSIAEIVFVLCRMTMKSGTLLRLRRDLFVNLS